MPDVITENIDLWTSALVTKSSAGRGSNGKVEAYGIKKLRELILELAVRGKLIPQDPNDEPAQTLLERIEKEKAHLLKKGQIKKGKALPDIGDDEKQFALPKGWQWRRLQDISLYIQRGKGPQYADTGKVKVVSQKCIQWAGFDLAPARYVDDTSLEKYQAERFLKKGDLLWNSTGTGTVGRTNVVPDIEADSLVADSHVTIIRPLLADSNFLWCYLSAPGIQSRIEPEHENALVSGTTNQVELNTSAVVQLVVPIPPLAEQHRIVANVDELMALCDQLEQQQTSNIEAHQTLVEILLGTLTKVKSQEEFTEAWTRIADHFDTLVTTEHSIDQLKQTILQLAVRGKLVEQDPNDEPAEGFYEKKIEIPKGYVRSNKQSIKGMSPVAAEALPALPKSWTYRSVDNLYGTNHVLDYADGNHGSLYPRQEDFGAEGVLFLTAAQISNKGEIDWEECPRLAFDKAKLLTKGWSRDGDVFFTHNATVGRTALAEACLENEFLLGTSVTFYRINENSIHRKYLYLYFSSASWYSQAEAVMQQTTRNQVSITKQALFFIALPPLAEQKRIVETVDNLMPLLEQLRIGIKNAATTQLLLADAIVEQAVA